MRSYQSSKERGETKELTPAKQAAKYLGKRVRRLYPLLLLGIFTCFVARNIFVLHNPVSTWPHLLVSSILEMSGIVITGIGMSEPDLWFPAGWYISVLLVCGYLVYYLVQHVYIFSGYYHLKICYVHPNLHPIFFSFLKFFFL